MMPVVVSDVTANAALDICTADNLLEKHIYRSLNSCKYNLQVQGADFAQPNLKPLK